ncbi:hypothetical protein F2Q69_00006653 [Brassica cretica]|uniref:Uncharacterized protein n=1 Tax=Brassica cretica TaxID=69181 RepID=A0A8S9P631_BRACR|nr:hypothetical protein F2Q69_00006653 [Brassica cretica]
MVGTRRPLRPYKNPEVSSLDPEIFDWNPEEPEGSSLDPEIFDRNSEAIGEPRARSSLGTRNILLFAGTVLRLPRQGYYWKSLTCFRGCWCGCYDPSARLRCFPRLEKQDFDCSLYMPSSTRSNNETQLLFAPDPASLERSIRKEARSSSIDNTTCSSVDFCQPPSTQTLVPSTDTRSPLSIEDTHFLSTDIFYPTSIDTSIRTAIDTEPRDMVATLILV